MTREEKSIKDLKERLKKENELSKPNENEIKSFLKNNKDEEKILGRLICEKKESLIVKCLTGGVKSIKRDFIENYSVSGEEVVFVLKKECKGEDFSIKKVSNMAKDSQHCSSRLAFFSQGTIEGADDEVMLSFTLD